QGESVPETPEHVTISENLESPDKMMTGNEDNLSDEHTVQSDESMKTVSANDKNDLSVDKRVGANVDVVNVDVVDVDDIQSEEVSVDKTPGPGIA
ncbi:hypothetical protein A2U01_0076066, partial [Trifolium medium]|nr:hypothetical protein [Trifolium medium]